MYCLSAESRLYGPFKLLKLEVFPFCVHIIYGRLLSMTTDNNKVAHVRVPRVQLLLLCCQYNIHPPDPHYVVAVIEDAELEGLLLADPHLPSCVSWRH